MHKQILVAYLLAKLNRTGVKGGHACCLKTSQAQETERNVLSVTNHTPFPAYIHGRFFSC